MHIINNMHDKISRIFCRKFTKSAYIERAYLVILTILDIGGLFGN